MVGNTSTPTIALCALALHASIQTSCHAVAEEEQSSIIADGLNNGRSSHQRKYLRRSTTQHERMDGGDEEFSESKQQQQQERLRLRITLYSLGAEFLRGQSLLPIEEEPGQSLSAFVTHPPLEKIIFDGTDGDECVDRQWYPDIHNPTIACTNSHLSSSSSWSSDPSIIEALLFDSSEACCHALVDLVGDDNSYNDGEVVECSVIDDCSEAKFDTDTTAISTTSTTTTEIDIAQQRRLSCAQSKGFHPDTVNGIGCTNDLKYPPPWLKIEDKMFYPTAKACCDWFFRDGEDCPVTDICAGGGGGGEGEGPAPSAPTKQSSGGSSGCLWHIETELSDGCTNDSKYPIQWMQSQSKANMMHPTAKQCCDKMMPNQACKFYDRGCDATPKGGPPPGVTPPTPKAEPPAATSPKQSSGGSSGCLWHVDTGTSTACTNDSNYPAVWGERLDLRVHMLHATAKACCDKMMQGKPCQHNDRGCAAGPKPGGGLTAPTPSAGGSPGCPWHAETRLEDGCTNDSIYPPVWDRPEIKVNMLHATAKACCDKMMPKKPCKHYARGCTPKTQRPTMRPVPLPTPPPTPRPPKYYVDERTGKCVSDKETVKPEWITITYPTYNRCCESGSRNSRECLRNQPKIEKNPEKPGQEGKHTNPYAVILSPVQWYVDPASELCVSDKEKPMPDWIDEVFARYHLCCDKTVNKLLCLKATPSLIKTDDESTETYAPTPAPDALYFLDHTTGICVSESEKPIPSYITATFDDYNRCCIVESKTYEKCIEKKPALDTALAIGPSSAPNPVPAKFYLQDSSSLCVNEADFPSTYTVTTYEDYDECCKKSWMQDLCLLQRPTMSPSGFPTMSPSTPWPTAPGFCPEPYDPSGATKYKKNSEVEVDQVVYRCKPPPYSTYCNNSNFQPPQEDPGPDPKPQKNSDDPDVIPIVKINNGGGAGPLWKEAWERLYMCVYSPTTYPTTSPNAPAPTCKTRWHPGDLRKKVCTNSAIFPVLWSQDPTLRVAFFADTADECCEKFYPDQKCRQRDEC